MDKSYPRIPMVTMPARTFLGETKVVAHEAYEELWHSLVDMEAKWLGERIRANQALDALARVMGAQDPGVTLSELSAAYDQAKEVLSEREKIMDYNGPDYYEANKRLAMELSDCLSALREIRAIERNTDLINEMEAAMDRIGEIVDSVLGEVKMGMRPLGRCICSEINVRHCPVHNESDFKKEREK